MKISLTEINNLSNTHNTLNHFFYLIIGILTAYLTWVFLINISTVLVIPKKVSNIKRCNLD